MLRVHKVLGIEMVSGLVKRNLALAILMHVHSEKTGMVRQVLIRKIENFNLYQNTTHGSGRKDGGTVQQRIAFISTYFCHEDRLLDI